MDTPKLVKLIAVPAAGLGVFVLAALVLMRILPQPHRSLDYLVIGTGSVMVALLVLFLLTLVGRPSDKP